jgi:ubiquinone/menaquinone biosynthesis C-methylase UbiE
MAKPPAELEQVVSAGDFPPGGALDVGCGDGVNTVFLAEKFHPTIGFDVSPSAVRQARERHGRSANRPPMLMIAAAPTLAFRDSSFALVFDRGCMHTLPPSEWSSYIREVDRVLAPGGRFQLYFLRRLQQRSPARRLLARLRQLLGRGKNLLKRDVLQTMLPAGLEIEEFGRVTSVTEQGHRFLFMHAVLRKGLVRS